MLKRPSEDTEAHVTRMECFLGDMDLRFYPRPARPNAQKQRTDMLFHVNK